MRPPPLPLSPVLRDPPSSSSPDPSPLPPPPLTPPSPTTRASKILREILHSKHSWRVSLNAAFVTCRLRPRHVEALLLQSLDHPRLALRFFNFLGLHRGFPHSLLSFSILALALLRAGLHWPASNPSPPATLPLPPTPSTPCSARATSAASPPPSASTS